MRAIFMQDWLGIFEKPAGLVTHATVDKKRDNFQDRVRKGIGSPNARILHRLDAPTSGLLAFCLDPCFHKQADSLMADSIKEYLLICSGNFCSPKLVLKNHLKEKKGLVHVVHSGGQMAHTEVKLLQSNQNLHLCLARLYTGRRHQIRVQMAHAGFPVLGDGLYGGIPDSQLYLHAFRFEFLWKGERILAATDYPERFNAAKPCLKPVMPEPRAKLYES